MPLYPTTLIVSPMTSWPGSMTPPSQRVQSQFSASLTTTLQLLNRELAHLAARAPVMEVAIPREQFRRDGRPRADARASHPGVALSLPHTRVGPLRYATDRFVTWQDNLRAISLGLEALRKIDRYGITRRNEQYTGFAAIGAGAAQDPVTDALEFLRVSAQILRPLSADDAAGIKAAYRLAVLRLHPDAGGSTTDFQRLRSAMETLDTARRP